MKPEIHSYDSWNTARKASLADPDPFWEQIARTFTWREPWKQVRSGNFSEVNMKWFDGATLNMTENCLDRHLESCGDRTALIWEPNDPFQPGKNLTFNELYMAVCRFANVLESLEVQKGDRVCLYLPMIPEAVIAMLACARIGAIHSVVFGGFSAASLADRINDARCTVLITADSTYRGRKEIKLKDIANEALELTDHIRQTVVVRNTGNPIVMQPGRDLWWHELFEQADYEHTSVPVEAEHPLFILYTSGSTGRPKGIVHTTGGYMVYSGYTFRNVFQIEDGDVYWCTADVGWITGHSYLVYGPLLNATTTVLFEGVPNYPDFGRFWDVVDKYRVNVFYTAPTAIRALEQAGTAYVENRDLSSLRVLGTVGEPINEEAWHWYHKYVGRERCHVVDTYWQTETGGIMITPLPGITDSRPGWASYPLPGIDPVLVNDQGQEIRAEGNETIEGNLCFRQPWPGISRTTWGNHERFVNTYFAAFPGKYFTGDGARMDSEGRFRITGRVDDVLNVSGHRIGTAEIENVIDEHELIAECAVVGYPHEIKGQGIYAFVICYQQQTDPDTIVAEVRNMVAEQIGAFARPDKIQPVEALPKTRSGKIMRRILRKIVEGEANNLGDISTLLEPGVVYDIQKGLLI